MISFGKCCRLAGLILLGLCTLGASASEAEAAWLGFRNDTKDPIIVQGMSVVAGQTRQGRRHILQPGQEGWDIIAAPGLKKIIIVDAKQPTRVLYQDSVNIGATDQFFSIQLDTPAKPAKGTDAAKAKLVPATGTTTPPPGGGLGIAKSRR